MSSFLVSKLQTFFKPTSPLILIEKKQGPITIEGQFFAGSQFTPLGSTTGITTFETPLFNLQDKLVGRLIGYYVTIVLRGGAPSVAVGLWNFQLFKEDDKMYRENWITVSSGFNSTLQIQYMNVPNVILNGTGCYLGAKGDVVSEPVLPNEPSYDSSIPKYRWILTLR